MSLINLLRTVLKYERFRSAVRKQYRIRRISLTAVALRCSAADISRPTVEESSVNDNHVSSSEDILRSISDHIRAEHGAYHSFDANNVQTIADYLIRHEVKPGLIVSMYVKQPQLLPSSFRSWEQLIYALCANATIPVYRVPEMAIACPQILRVKPSVFEANFTLLRSLGFQDKSLNNLLVSNPFLLVMDKRSIEKQFRGLMHIFTLKDIQSLAITCPNVFLEDVNDIQAKVRYIYNEMHLDQKQMVESQALMLSLSQLKLRRELAIRTGYFTKPHPKHKIDNPHLKTITDTKVSNFLDAIGISVEEFTVFEKMLEQELKLDDHDDDNSERGDDDYSETTDEEADH